MKPVLGNEGGHVNPAVLGHVASPLIGGAIGYSSGTDTEDRLKKAALGAAIGSGLAFGASKMGSLKGLMEKGSVPETFSNKPGLSKIESMLAPTKSLGLKEIKDAKAPKPPEPVSEGTRATPGYRARLENGVKKAFNRALNSPSVDLEAKKDIRQHLKDATGLEEPEIKELSDANLPGREGAYCKRLKDGQVGKA